MPKKSASSEAALIKAIKDVLEIFQAKGSLYYARLSTTGIPTREGGFRPNSSRGLPDFMIWLPAGTWIGIEAKAPGGKLSEGQKTFALNMAKLGHEHHIIREIDELIHVLRTWNLCV